MDGLRDGLRQLGYEDGKQILLEIRDTKADLKLVEEAARIFEREKINLIYAVDHLCRCTGQECYLAISRLFFPLAATPSPCGLVRALGDLEGDLPGVQYSITDLRGNGSRS